jgi:hypothetical protein
VSDTPEQIAARLYPNSWIRPEGDSYADALRAAFLTGHRLGKAEGGARAVNAVVNLLKTYKPNLSWAVSRAELIEQVRALSPSK